MTTLAEYLTKAAHPKPEEMAEVEIDSDEFMADMRAKFPEAMVQLDRLLGERSATDRVYREFIFPTLRVVFANGVTSERMRIADWLIALSKRANDNGSTVRARAFADMALDLAQSMGMPR